MEPCEGNTGTPERTDSVSTRRARIAELAQQHAGEGLTNLHRFIDLTWLRTAYQGIRKDGATGIDGENWASYGQDLEANLADLLRRVKTNTYRAPPVRRVHIPKGTGPETRPIGIPTLEDKIVQKAVVMLLEPILEREFHAGSYGFRPGRSAHQALSRIRHGIEDEGARWILDVDIRKFFDTLDHGRLREMVRQRVRDGIVTRLIDIWLKAGVMEDGVWHQNEEGTPQGGVISPLLANLYLHEVLDTWLETIAPAHLKGQWFLVRYADDFVIGCEYREEAEKLMRVLPKRFGKYGLTLHPDKTRLVCFERPVTRDGRTRMGKAPETFDFLAFTHHWTLSRWGAWIVSRKTAQPRFTRALGKVNDWLKRNRHQRTSKQHTTLKAKLRGHDAYYGIAGNLRSLRNFHYEVLKRWRYWLNRRGGKRRLSWDRFWKGVNNFYRMPPARIVHATI